MGNTLRILLIVRGAMLTSIILYFFIAEQFAPTGSPNPVLLYALTGMALSLVAAVFVMRRILVLRSAAVLATQPGDATALNRWRTGYLVTYCLCEAIALYGLVLRFIGFSFFQVAPFYLAGFILLLFYVPRAPSNTIG
jgi:F0F1-type ATP synthase membrane subunit c/vacuolar-type H+-ATPase subunit K